jgi:hypothetical protein
VGRGKAHLRETEMHGQVGTQLPGQGPARRPAGFFPAPSVVISEIHVPGVCFGRGAAIAGRGTINVWVGRLGHVNKTGGSFNLDGLA